MQERFKFVIEVGKGEKTIAMLCREFGISRTAGYKWLRRYREDPSPEVLEDRSRRPQRSPLRVDDFIEDAIVAVRKRYPHWGPRSHTPPYSHPFADVTAPNQVWCIDFKGHFRTLDGTTVYPLTLTDAFSRFILRCEVVLDPRSAEVRDVLESAFLEYGLPEAIRSDNGPPFASTGPGGLTELSAWWIQLGIRHERIDPGKPQQNGRHERMHRTLKYETAVPPAKTPRGQQGRFDRWRKQFNHERPHEGIDMVTPDYLYVPSAKLFSEKLDRDAYPFDVERALVNKLGYVRWQGRRVFIGRALRYQLVELRPTQRRRWLVCYGPLVLGSYDERDRSARLRQISARKRRTSNGVGDALRALPVDSRRRLPTAKPPPPLSRPAR